MIAYFESLSNSLVIFDRDYGDIVRAEILECSCDEHLDIALDDLGYNRLSTWKLINNQLTAWIGDK